MKNGLLVYQAKKDNVFNIGDYIQSLAAAQFFNNEIDVYINREFLDEYSGDETKLIMNGWFMHQPKHWPPSSKIHPLFVSFHMNSLAKEEMLKEESIQYFKKHEPIGCRDYDTILLLRSKGVDAYFTGCMTLTLGKYYKSTSENKQGIYFVDAYYHTSRKLSDVLRMSLLLLTKYNLISKISQKARGSKSIRNLLSYSFFYSSYSKIFTDEVLLDAEYILQEIPDTFASNEEKFNYAKSLLKKYSEAKFVVTSRIHAALPCLAIETPVLYVENVNQPEVSYCRLNGLRELFNVVTYDKGIMKIDFINVKISKNTIFKNKEDYKLLKKKLITTCEQFINS